MNVRSLLNQVGCAAIVLAFVPGCLTLKPQHDELAAKVAELESQTDTRSAKLDEEIAAAEATLAELKEKLAEAEKLLRGSQAGLGVRMDDVELQFMELRGAADNAEYVASATNLALQELRGDVDSRLSTLETKLNEATSIPESKGELWNEGERMLKKRAYKQARRLFRTYVSRYPGDPRLAEAMFKVGLTYYGERDYKSALGEYYRIIQEMPDSPVVADALYYSGLGFAKLGQCKNAIAYFNAVLQPQGNATDRHKTQAQGQIAILEKDSGEICYDKGDSGAGAAGKQAIDKAAPAKSSKARSKK
ncbi:MAG TPA: outer membrane protein assembly factor BamD [Nannocystis exedens]|nr:outer membrane protein assembly factor BamD [Nannocystis exedens]